MGPFPFEGDEDADLINAGKQTVTLLPELPSLVGILARYRRESGAFGDPLTIPDPL